MTTVGAGLIRGGGRVATARELAEAVDVSKEHVRQTLDRLQEDDIVDRQDCAGDYGAHLYRAVAGLAGGRRVDLAPEPAGRDRQRWRKECFVRGRWRSPRPPQPGVSHVRTRPERRPATPPPEGRLRPAYPGSRTAPCPSDPATAGSCGAVDEWRRRSRKQTPWKRRTSWQYQKHPMAHSRVSETTPWSESRKRTLMNGSRRQPPWRTATSSLRNNHLMEDE